MDFHPKKYKICVQDWPSVISVGSNYSKLVSGPVLFWQYLPQPPPPHPPQISLSTSLPCNTYISQISQTTSTVKKTGFSHNRHVIFLQYLHSYKIPKLYTQRTQYMQFQVNAISAQQRTPYQPSDSSMYTTAQKLIPFSTNLCCQIAQITEWKVIYFKLQHSKICVLKTAWGL